MCMSWDVVCAGQWEGNSADSCVCLPLRSVSSRTSLDGRRLLQTTSSGWPVPTKVGPSDRPGSQCLLLGCAEIKIVTRKWRISGEGHES